ncbi:hypothetical protein YC2023_047336 [Brassica napus]
MMFFYIILSGCSDCNRFAEHRSFGRDNVISTTNSSSSSSASVPNNQSSEAISHIFFGIGGSSYSERAKKGERCNKKRRIYDGNYQFPNGMSMIN